MSANIELFCLLTYVKRLFCILLLYFLNKMAAISITLDKFESKCNNKDGWEINNQQHFFFQQQVLFYSRPIADIRAKKER